MRNGKLIYLFFSFSIISAYFVTSMYTLLILSIISIRCFLKDKNKEKDKKKDDKIESKSSGNDSNQMLIIISLLLIIIVIMITILIRRKFILHKRQQSFCVENYNQRYISYYDYLCFIKNYGETIEDIYRDIALNAAFSNDDVTEKDIEEIRTFIDAYLQTVLSQKSKLRLLKYKYINAII